MADSPATHHDLLPCPRRLRALGGVFWVPRRAWIIAADASREADDAARLIRSTARLARLDWRITSRQRGRAERTTVIIRRRKRAFSPQSYRLRIDPSGIELTAGDAAGFRYGAVTLGQLLATGRRRIRAMQIDDRPDFPVRGVMLDISRDKVPKTAELRRLIDLLADWKINHLQLYMEHTFAYRGHERVWRGASPMTGPQIERLDADCRARGIELVPNQNSFGHMERWLKHPRYAPLAETRQPWTTPWGVQRDEPTTLCPLDARSIRLVEGLYDQLLPHFSSRLVNVGCDETWELGQGRSRSVCARRGRGRVYLDYLLKLHRAVRRRGRRMMFWADMILQRPRLLAALPRDIVALVWGYEADHPFDVECRRVARAGLRFYVCPGTSSWCSFAGRTSNCLVNIRNAARAGRRHGAEGLLVTDWGDFGHRQYAPASMPGLLYGAAVGWCAASNERMNVARAVGRHAFGDPTGTAGRQWCEIGDVHEAAGLRMKNRALPFVIMHKSFDDIGSIKGLTAQRIRRMQQRVARLRRRISTQTARMVDRGSRDHRRRAALIRRELEATLRILEHACRRGLAAMEEKDDADVFRELARDVRGMIAAHRRLWRTRNRPGGLAASVEYYLRNLREYEAAIARCTPRPRSRRRHR